MREGLANLAKTIGIQWPTHLYKENDLHPTSLVDLRLPLMAKQIDMGPRIQSPDVQLLLHEFVINPVRSGSPVHIRLVVRD